MLEEQLYDRWGRPKYNPNKHLNHGKEYTTKELRYICKNYGYGKVREIADTLGRNENSIRRVAQRLKKTGEFEKYANDEVTD